MHASATSSSFELSPIKAMELAASRIPGVITLAQGIPSFPTPAVIKDFVIERIRQGLCDKYSLTVGLAELREEISISLRCEGLSYDPDGEIIVTVGSIEGITASILAVTSPGDEVIVPSPSYVSYRGSLAIAGCMPRFVELDEDRNFDFHVERMEEAIGRKTSAILICSPNNPTGTHYSEEKTRAVAALAEKHNLTLIIDEVYKDFYYGGERHFTPAAIPEVRKRVIRVCSFSKAFAMTGWRVGFIHTDAGQMRRILKFHDAMVTCAPVVSQYAAIAALRHGETALRDFRDEFKKRRDYTLSVLDQMSMYLDYQMPKATYFVFPRIKDSVPLARDSTKLAYDILERAKVAVVPGVAFGPSGESHVRIMYGREWPDLQEGMERLFTYFSGSKSRQATKKMDAASVHDEEPPSIARQIAAPFIQACARVYVSRCRPLVVGVVGSLGKTVFKRTIADILAPAIATRATALSYNTDVGLPLAILNLKVPKTALSKVLFPFQLFTHALLSNFNEKVLVVEYGVAKQGDAAPLLRVVKPDWLVITETSAADPNVDASAILGEVRTIAHNLSTDRILWCADDPALRSLNLPLQPDLSFSLSDVHESTINTGKQVYGFHRDYVGKSARLALVAAVKLAERLGVEGKQIIATI
ncbi:MAG: aminotransferase class I/II-fold pyridoxal phosphate-dependent enzyme [Oligoflexia bacterium]|nr:aminotransferase class I/II-fold pyridoxal phosphate-dependent enzyme [Oligoflexia bacterium]